MTDADCTGSHRDRGQRPLLRGHDRVRHLGADQVGHGLSAGDIRSALAGLHERGLVSQTSDDPVRYVASSPGTVEAMISNRLRELRAAQEVVDLLTDKRRAAQLSGDAAGVFEVVHGQQPLRHHALHLLHTARSEVINVVKPPVIAVQASERARPGDAIRNRTIFETGHWRPRGRWTRSATT